MIKNDAITPRHEDFAQWYTDIVKKADLIAYTSVKGCVVFRPYAYAIWEKIQETLNAEFKKTSHENIYMPMFIPESLLKKEADHVEGFAPEVAWVTHSGETKLQERMCVRPTSETLFCEHYNSIIESHRDLPKKYNQWCSVVRMEKTTRPFLRSSEFLWQEGHTAHATSKEAVEEALNILDIYSNMCEDILAIPVIKGEKSQKEKFAGAKNTYTIEALMHDGKSLQSGTTHDFGDGFAKAFNIQYTDKENKLQYVHQSSWGVSTRLIGALIMVHSDDNGLVLPPKIAPNQVVIIPVMQHKEGVIEKAKEIKESLNNFRVIVDDSDKKPGWKYSEHEMKGVPIRIEVGPKDIEKNQCILVRRDKGEKKIIPLDQLKNQVQEELENMQLELLEKAKIHRNQHTYIAKDYNELTDLANNKAGFIKSMWCGDVKCEEKVKEELSITSRCMPFTQEHISDNCPICGEKAKTVMYWGKAY
ncbi:MAG: proline--tRNA ligase [Lachnospirales bacterium]